MSRPLRKFWIFLILFVVLVATGPFFWMPWLGRFLVNNEGPAKADAAIVLAGDQWGYRILRAAELARQGYVGKVLVSGPPFYDIHECDVAIDFAVHHGYPRESFIGAPNAGLSTREEAAFMLDELQRRNLHSFLLVTSDYHTGRAARIYRSIMKKRGGGPNMRAVAAPDKYWGADRWWKSREGLKVTFMEWSKTLATAVGI